MADLKFDITGYKDVKNMCLCPPVCERKIPIIYSEGLSLHDRLGQVVCMLNELNKNLDAMRDWLENQLPIEIKKMVVEYVDQEVAKLRLELIAMIEEKQQELIQMIDQLKTEIETQITAINNKISALTLRVSDIETDITSIQTNITAILTTIGNINDSIGQINTKISEINTQITDINETLALHATQIENILNSISTIVSDISGLSARVKALEDRPTGGVWKNGGAYILTLTNNQVQLQTDVVNAMFGYGVVLFIIGMRATNTVSGNRNFTTIAVGRNVSPSNGIEEWLRAYIFMNNPWAMAEVFRAFTITASGLMILGETGFIRKNIFSTQVTKEVEISGITNDYMPDIDVQVYYMEGETE